MNLKGKSQRKSVNTQDGLTCALINPSIFLTIMTLSNLFNSPKHLCLLSVTSILVFTNYCTLILNCPVC